MCIYIHTSSRSCRRCRRIWQTQAGCAYASVCCAYADVCSLYAQPQTLSEDLADAGGLKVALMAYKQWYASGHAEADVGHAEAEAAHLRRFFMAYAQNWCYKERAAERGVLARDVHAPGTDVCC